MLTIFILININRKIRKNVIVGVYNGKLTRTNLYAGLIGLNMLEEDTKNEFIKSA